MLPINIGITILIMYINSEETKIISLSLIKTPKNSKDALSLKPNSEMEKLGTTAIKRYIEAIAIKELKKLVFEPK